MSDPVGNPMCLFCHAKAHMQTQFMVFSGGAAVELFIYMHLAIMICYEDD